MTPEEQFAWRVLGEALDAGLTLQEIADTGIVTLSGTGSLTFTRDRTPADQPLIDLLTRLDEAGQIRHGNGPYGEGNPEDS
jgi:hypothetical protein